MPRIRRVKIIKKAKKTPPPFQLHSSDDITELEQTLEPALIDEDYWLSRLELEAMLTDSSEQ